MRIPKKVLLSAVLIIVISLIAIHRNARIERIAFLGAKIKQFGHGIRVLEETEEKSPVTGFTVLTRLYDMDALQGVASDGTYLYNTTSWEKNHPECIIYKRNKDGTLIMSYSDPHLDGTDCSQVNGIHIHDNKLYIGAFTAPNGTRHGCIKVFNASDLSYIEEHQVKDHLCEGGVFHDDAWWVIYDDWPYISKYDTDWNWVADYALSYSGISPNGIIWIGDYIYVNNHENARSNTCDIYKWNGAGFDPVARLARPTDHCTQGIYKEPGEDIIWWAERNGSGQGIHNIVKSTIEHS